MRFCLAAPVRAGPLTKGGIMSETKSESTWVVRLQDLLEGFVSEKHHCQSRFVIVQQANGANISNINLKLSDDEFLSAFRSKCHVTLGDGTPATR